MLPTNRNEPLRIFIGYDEREAVAYHVLCESLIANARRPISITPLHVQNLPMYKRPYGKQSTAFTYSRFLVPFLCDYKGIAIFMDCDMILRDDIWKILDGLKPGKAVYCVKHDYEPRTEGKFLGNPQVKYPRKNWSSVMVFDCAKCKALTPDAVNTAEPSYLHQFKWLKTSQIGEIDVKWNHLVGEYAENPDAKLVHYTLGTPCFREYQDQEYVREWFVNYWRVKG